MLFRSLESYALALPFEDSLILIREFTPKADTSRRQALYEMGGDIALAGGNFMAAADFFVRAAEGRPDFLLKAARCRLVAGDSKGSENLLSSIPDAFGGIDFVEEKRLLYAWIKVLDGEIDKAFSSLRQYKESKSSSYNTRQALLLLWIMSTRPEFGALGEQAKGFSTAEIRAILAKRFPNSPELAIVQSKVLIRPSALLLAGLSQEGQSNSDDRNIETSSPASKVASQEETHTPKITSLSNALLQVGLFSRKENAIALTGKLKSQGFNSIVEERSSSESETRWAVIVEAGTDWMGTLARLKDLGYETYLLP